MNHSPVPSEPVTNVDQLVSFFAEAAKPKERWLVGLEHEKLGARADGSPVPYRGPGGVAELLGTLVDHRGWRGVREGENLIGAGRNVEEITLEPGMQMELSGPPLPGAQACSTLLRGHICGLSPIARGQGIRFIAGGYRPFGTLDDVH